MVILGNLSNAGLANAQGYLARESLVTLLE